MARAVGVEVIGASIGRQPVRHQALAQVGHLAGQGEVEPGLGIPAERPAVQIGRGDDGAGVVEVLTLAWI
jgi:hypothetical protein